MPIRRVSVSIMGMKNLYCLLLLVFCCAGTAFAQHEVILKNDGSSYTRMILTKHSDDPAAELLSRTETLGWNENPYIAQKLSFSADFGGNLNTLSDTASGIGLIFNAAPSGATVVNAGQASIGLSGSFQLTNGAQTLINGTFFNAQMLGDTERPTTILSAVEPLYPFNTDKFIYITIPFNIDGGTLGTPLCNKGKMIIRLHGPGSCTILSKRCFLSSTADYTFYTTYINSFNSLIYDITIDKFEQSCGQQIATPTATRTSTATPTSTLTSTPTRTSTTTPTRTITPSFTPTRTFTAVYSPTPTNTATRTPTHTSTPIITATRTPTRTSTPIITATGTPSWTATPAATINSLKPVLPIVECVKDIGNGSALAVFAYNNLNSTTVKIDSGVSTDNINIVSNALSSDSGKPNNFLPGINKSAFEVTFTKNSPVSWMLEYQGTGANEAFADSNTPICQDDRPPVCVINSSGTAYSSVCQGPLTVVLLDGSMSKDPEGKFLNSYWTTDCPGLIENPASLSTKITLSDPGAGKSVNCSVSLLISDTVSQTNCSASFSVSPCDGGCKSTNIKGAQFTVDSTSLQIATLAKKLASQLIKQGGLSEKKRADKVKKQATELYSLIWRNIWSISSVTLNCTNTVICSESSNEAVLSSIVSNTGKLTRLVKTTANRLTKITGKKSYAEKLIKQADKLSETSLNEINQIPQSYSVCN